MTYLHANQLVFQKVNRYVDFRKHEHIGKEFNIGFEFSDAIFINRFNNYNQKVAQLYITKLGIMDIEYILIPTIISNKAMNLTVINR